MSRGRLSSVAALGLLSLVGFPVSPAHAQTESGGSGVFPDSIVFGQSAALSGNARELGENMNLGVRAAFEEANRNGGIHGRALRLVARDDLYEGEAAIANTRELISHGVFGLIGAVGTPTSRVAEPIASAAQVPYIGAFTGAELLRGDQQRYVVNLRASYYQETEEMVERLTTDLGFSRIAILYQDDSYGFAGLTGVRQALDRRNMALVGEGTYVRNTVAVKRALLDLNDANPQAVIIIGAYGAAAEFTLWARKIGMRAMFVNISFVGSNALLNALRGAGTELWSPRSFRFPATRVFRWWPGTRRPCARSTPRLSRASFRWKDTWPAGWWWRGCAGRRILMARRRPANPSSGHWRSPTRSISAASWSNTGPETTRDRTPFS